MEKKLAQIFCYIGAIPGLWIFLLIGALACNDRKEIGKDITQSLMLVIIAVAGNIISSILSFVFIGLALMPIVNIFVLVFAIMGLVKVAKEEDTSLPIFGNMNWFK